MPADFEVVLNTALNRIDEGFSKVYGKIDVVRDKVDSLKDDYIKHMPACKDRFSEIEKKMAIREALNNLEDVHEKEQFDWWKWFIRLTIGTIAVGIMTFIGMMIVGGAKITLY